ncbi:hypothetical protein AB0J06_16125, partial [Micromonospora sp. NPDC049679]
LANLGGVNSLNQALVGTLGVVVLALAIDLCLALLGTLTRPGRRARTAARRRVAPPAVQVGATAATTPAAMAASINARGQ